MTENGSKQFEQKKENRLNINDYPIDFQFREEVFKEFDNCLDDMEREIVTNASFSGVIPQLDILYKVMELYYRCVLLRKTIKEQIENENK